VTSKTPFDRALDLFVYGPVGLALSARDLLPEIVERGRQQLGGQVSTARVIGQFAVQQGQVEAEKAFARARSSAESTLEQVVDGTTKPSRPPTTTNAPTTLTPVRSAAPTPSVAVPRTPRPTLTEVRPEPDPPAPTPAAVTAVPVVAVSDLAVPSYDSLSASQVVPRLSGLTAAELEAVRTYEAANRGRKTILNRVAQLQAR